MQIAGLLSSLALAALLAGCANGPVPASPDASAALATLLAESDEAALRRNPIDALYRGDLRFAGEHGDYLSDAHLDAERRAAQQDLARLAAIDRSALAPAARLAYDTFAWQRENDLADLAPAFKSFRVRLPINHYDGWHLFFPDLSSGEGAAPYRTPKDYADGLSRIDGYVGWLGQAEVRLAEGAALGIVQPRFVAEKMVQQFDEMARQGPDDSPFYGPVRRLPADFTAAQKEQIARDYAAAVHDRLAPAFARMRDYLRDGYLPATRSSVGLSALPGGADWYRRLVAENTTTALTPEAIHQLGLDEVARIRREMEVVRAQTGFAGTLSEFQELMRSDPRFRPASPEWLKQGYEAIGRQVDATLDTQFAHRPKTPLLIRPTPAYQERSAAAASYESGSADATRPGTFFFNTHDLASRTTFGMQTLYLHEAVPGHHFQTSLAQENEALPKLLRFGGNTAYAEGWALYAESLGADLGLFTDPVQRYGHLDDEMLRAMRLVVDTGLHLMGWTREQAIDYLLANSAMNRTDATAEVERYIVNPGQALAYKIGQITLRRLRNEAETGLGPKFDVRAFHDQVLGTGALPMAVLEAKINAWIAAGGPPSY